MSGWWVVVGGRWLVVADEWRFFSGRVRGGIRWRKSGSFVFGRPEFLLILSEGQTKMHAQEGPRFGLSLANGVGRARPEKLQIIESGEEERQRKR
jgi:hypothetical protein